MLSTSDFEEFHTLVSLFNVTLFILIFRTQDDTDSSLRPMSRRMAQASRSPVGSNLQSLFQGHPMVISHMVPTLLRLYVDVEFTDQHNQVWNVRCG